MAKVIDINKHGIRREIDHQYKPKKRAYKPKSKDIDISIENTRKMHVKQANNAQTDI